MSILAGIVAARPARTASTPDDPDAGTEVAPARVAGSAVDPVCGMTVATVASSIHVEQGDEVVWFCGPGCRDAFVADPAAFTT